MTKALPSGFITTSANVSNDLSRLDQLLDTELYKLWKVFSSSKTFLDRDKKARLENLFWRIWSNPAVRISMSGRLLAKLFQPMVEGESSLPEPPAHFDITPTPGSPSFKPAIVEPEQASFLAEASSSLRTVRPSSPPRQATELIKPWQPQTQPINTTTPNPSSILKKPRTEPDQVPTSQQECPPPSHPGGRLSSPAPNLYGISADDSTLVASSDSTTATREKRTSFASTSSGNTKPRSTTPQRKSSQGSAKSDLLVPKNGTRKSAASTTSTSKPLGLKAAPYRQQSTGIQSHQAPEEPADPWQDVDSDSEPGEKFLAEDAKGPEWLVAKDFRGKFVDSQKRVASQTNLPSLGKTLSVRFLDELPQRHQHRGNGSVSVSERNDHPTSTKIVSESLVEASRRTGQESETNPAVDLPRTKSQLSMMVERERRASSLERVPFANASSVPTQNTKARDQDQAVDEDEEEGIVMGVGVGKTRVTKKGSKSDKRREKDMPNYHSPPPGPVW